MCSIYTHTVMLSTQTPPHDDKSITVIKRGIKTMDDDINYTVGRLVYKKLFTDKTNPDPFGYRHYACFFGPEIQWWEKGGFWRKLCS